MKSTSGDMKIAWNLTTLSLLLFLFVCCCRVEVCYGQDYDDEPKPKKKPMLELETCNGIFLTYNFQGREKEYPHLKNVTKQAWAFKADASLTNVGEEELKGWQMYIGFQHKEILVTMDGAITTDSGDLPAAVGNGTVIAGNPMTDLKTSIDTAGDFEKISVKIQMTGTQFGLKTGTNPMPKTIRLENDGFQCPGVKRRGTQLFVCCKKDPKAKAKNEKKTKYLPRPYGDVTIAYDVLQAFKNNYYAQVTIDNNHPLGRLDHWNLTWEWQRGEFINTLKGAYSRKKDPSECLYGPAGKFLPDFDFSQVANCEKKPVLSDLPAEKALDDKVGNLPFCCRNGSILPTTMDKSRARSIFQLQVNKIPPDNNDRTTLIPPLKWNIDGVLNPRYKCGSPVRVDPQEFPDPSGLNAITLALASWQIACNITKPKPKQSRCCVSFSAYYNESVIPCNTCSCGCPDSSKCDANISPMLLPSEALLVPFVNRTVKAKAWASLKHFTVPNKLPCGDNCPVSINWHVSADTNTGWAARITIFNWREYNLEDWFAAVAFPRAFENFEAVYSFNGTKIPKIGAILMQGFKGLNYLVAQKNGSREYDPKVPGKQQSVLSFNKKNVKGFDIRKDGFPSKVFFNGEECALPPHTPVPSTSARQSSISVVAVIFIGFITFLLMIDNRFY